LSVELVERAQSGDHGAFERLAEAAAGRMYGTASLIVRDPDAARDAVQDALIEACRASRPAQAAVAKGLTEPELLTRGMVNWC
jgi:DNA-directed RNA polymerase specialized sigma24 family protein